MQSSFMANNHKPLLVLDMDETLLHAIHRDTVIPRPGVQNFLQTMDAVFTLVIFTFGQRDYALDALKSIGALQYIPENRVFSRESSTVVNGHHMKRLSTCVCKDCLAKTVAVDDSPWNWMDRIYEGDVRTDAEIEPLKGPIVIPIKPYTGLLSERNDAELLAIRDFLLRRKPQTTIMADNYSFAFLSQSMSVLLTGVTLFAVKGVIVIVYASTGTPHVYTMEIALMWTLLWCTGAFFGFIVVALVTGASVYMMIQNLHAYFAVMLGVLVYSVFVVIECGDETSVQCKYLYPLSRVRLVEAGVNAGLVFLHVITTLGFIMSIKGSRELLTRSLAAGGGFYAVVTCVVVTLVQAHGMASSCREGGDFAEYTAVSEIETFLLFAGLGGVVYAAPVVFYVVAASKRITLANIYDTDAENGEIKNIEAGVPPLVRGAMAVAVVVYGILLFVVFGSDVLRTINVWIALGVLALSAISLALSFWQSGGAKAQRTVPMQTAYRTTQIAQAPQSMQAPVYGYQQPAVPPTGARTRPYWKNV